MRKELQAALCTSLTLAACGQPAKTGNTGRKSQAGSSRRIYKKSGCKQAQSRQHF